MNEQLRLIQAAKGRVKEIARVTKEVGKDSDKEKVVCYFGDNGEFLVKRTEKSWSIPGEITMPPNATVRQVAERLELLLETQ